MSVSALGGASVAGVRNQTPMLVARSHYEQVTTPRRLEAEIRSQGPTLEIDSTATRAALDMRSIGQFLDYRLQIYDQAASEGTARIVAEGRRMQAIERHEDTIAAIAKERGVRDFPSLEPHALPPPKVSFSPKTVEIQWVERGGATGAMQRKLTISWAPAGSVGPIVGSGAMIDRLA